jgi:putative methionine-R-sulfoxide reductase with GAF domain
MSKKIQAVSLEASERNVPNNMDRINRALKMLSECNRALIHAKKESALLSNICKIIVETGEYRLAWVGKAQHDEGKRVLPIAQKGFEDGYLKKAGITWSANNPKGHGPTGTAIRTDRVAICTDFLNDPKLLPWREQAIKRNYRSSIALPLKTHGKVFGALTIYSNEPNAFDEDEVKLLKELAADLAFGLSALHSRQAHKKAEEQLIESYKHLGSTNRKISLLLDLECRGKKRRKREVAEYILSSAINLSQASSGTIYRIENDNCFHLTLFDPNKKLSYFLALPLMWSKKLHGFIFLGFNDRTNLDSQELDFFSVFSVHATFALFNAKIFK